jgi:hypothetical protein
LTEAGCGCYYLFTAAAYAAAGPVTRTTREDRMRTKLKLNLHQLAVESFETDASGTSRGTVFAEESFSNFCATELGGTCDPREATCGDTCDIEANTCNGYTTCLVYPCG